MADNPLAWSTIRRGVVNDTTWRGRRGWRRQKLRQPTERARCTRQEAINVLKGAFGQEKLHNGGLLCPEFRGHGKLTRKKKDNRRASEQRREALGSSFPGVPMFSKACIPGT